MSVSAIALFSCRGKEHNSFFLHKINYLRSNHTFSHMDPRTQKSRSLSKSLENKRLRSLWEQSICRSKCLNPRSFRYFPFGAVLRTPHAVNVTSYSQWRKHRLLRKRLYRLLFDIFNCH